jgi:mono/diheme cytochrome c family protein
VSVIDRLALHAKLEHVAVGLETTSASRSVGEIPNDLSFLVDLRRRLKLAGNGPRALAVAGMRVFAAEYFSDSIGVVNADPTIRHVPGSISLRKRELLTPERVGDHLPSEQLGDLLTPEQLGERLFNDATLCFQQWQSCASCHPDGRADGLNWDLLNDGMGNPRNTKSMLLAHQTPPAMISGVRDRAETAVRAGIRHILFSVCSDADATGIDAYLKSLEPVPSPHLEDGELSEAALRGREVFQSAGCGECHPAPLYTDLKLHDVGTCPPSEGDRDLDTPTLVECWRTAPYLIDGRATAMEDVLLRHNKGDGHGKTQSLTPEQIRDLAAFVLSL